jgi:hypothetical protein
MQIALVAAIGKLASPRHPHTPVFLLATMYHYPFNFIDNLFKGFILNLSFLVALMRNADCHHNRLLISFGILF